MQNTNIINNTSNKKTIHAIVLRVLDDSTFEQMLEWPIGKTIKQVLNNYQRCYLGDKKVYKIIDFYISD